MVNLERFEFKSPSYKLRRRAIRYSEQELEQYREQSRFEIINSEWKSKANSKDEVRILIAGDLLCQESIIDSYHTSETEFDFKPCFDYLRPLFKSVDCVIGNLETPISQTAPYRGEIMTHEGPFYCNAPIEYLEALKYAGFDMLTTANNHTIDAGVRGVCETIENVRNFGFMQTGTFKEKEDKYLIVDICGFKVGFTAFSTAHNQMLPNLKEEGRRTLLNIYSEKRARKIYHNMKKAGAEYVIAFPHWGAEFTAEISEKQAKIAEELARIEYDAVIGAHAHVIQRFVHINEKPVLYSLGNLLTHTLNSSKESSSKTVLCELILSRKDGDVCSRIQFIPCRIMNNVNKIPFLVVPYNENIQYKADIMKKLTSLVSDVKTLLKVNDETLVCRKHSVDEESLKECMDITSNSETRVAKLCHFKKVEYTECVSKKNPRLEFDKKTNPERYKYLKSGVYYLNDRNAELVRITTKKSVIRLAREIKGYPITKILNYEGGNNLVRVFYTGKYVKSIEREAFKDFTALESIRLYDNLTYIGEEAFANCISMMGVILPNSVESVDRRAFKNCKSLLSIKIPPNVRKIADDAFEGCEQLTIYCKESSFAEEYAKNHQIMIRYMPL